MSRLETPGMALVGLIILSGYGYFTVTGFRMAAAFGF
jgi:hypothetical protein